MKTCSKCGTAKDEAEFYLNPRKMPLARCRECSRKATREYDQRDTLRRWREKNRAESNEYARLASLLHRSEQFKRAWPLIVAHYSGHCLGCGASGVPLCADHVIPLSKDGVNQLINLQPLCRPCNTSKRDVSVDYRPAGGEWIRRLALANPWLYIDPARPRGWHLTIKGRRELRLIRQQQTEIKIPA